jgi:hypothetical protein
MVRLLATPAEVEEATGRALRFELASTAETSKLISRYEATLRALTNPQTEATVDRRPRNTEPRQHRTPDARHNQRARQGHSRTS